MVTKTQTLLLPAHWAPYLINGDASGLSDAETAQIEACLKREGASHCVDCTEGEEFTAWHDARIEGVLAAGCLTYTFQIRK